ncbi:hypothetical protein FPE09_000415 [Salmonella enterica subsp. enterica serovar Braenderup]|nr:hypothetical protein [Salmonella enterica subsp. enterica serovar Braenderup]EBW6852513.1 hypothetical protein [Salmonella enterica subsp. enterica serovar Braenderup]ECD4823254.1 hypothetical protein [Salmonella enterica subsp. enterica serovar Braenderup]ECG5345474.1 hypothetical protein [Salmonella enterica subsp. enterica serovar Braenderup]EDQ6473745.1 hypothetical protein [Salmonella enterica subsp. enterica serovar Braenderup]
MLNLPMKTIGADASPSELVELCTILILELADVADEAQWLALASRLRLGLIALNGKNFEDLPADQIEYITDDLTGLLHDVLCLIANELKQHLH